MEREGGVGGNDGEGGEEAFFTCVSMGLIKIVGLIMVDQDWTQEHSLQL